MNRKTLLTVALLCTGVSGLVGCTTHTGYARSTGEVLDDAAITTKVKSALLVEKDVNSFDIKVQTFNGIVQMSGSVDSQWQIDKAVQIASAVAGVKNVKNDLAHKPE